MVNHTKLPWNIKHGSDHIRIEGSGGYLVFIIMDDCDSDDAAFLVKACNNHYQLLETLGKLEFKAQAVIKAYTRNPKNWTAELVYLDDWVEIARQVIAQAKE